MKRFIKGTIMLMLIIGIAVIWTPIWASAEGFDAEARLSHPIDASIANDTLSVHVDPQYTLDTEVGYTIKGARAYVGFTRIEDIQDTTSFGLDYLFADTPIGTFVRHDNYNMKSGLPDYDLTHVGLVLRYNKGN